jgi:homoserine dehydrogenase
MKYLSAFVLRLFLLQSVTALHINISRRDFAVVTATTTVTSGIMSAAAAALPTGAVKVKPLIVAVIGYTGGVGTCLLTAMDKINLQPFAFVRSSTMKIGGGSEVPVDFVELGKQLLEAAASCNGIPVVADVTASSVVQDEYKHWLSKGISVCTANKGIFAGDESTYNELLKSVTLPAKLLHETTVGAGLPVLGTITNLRAASHEIVKVEGVLSGTLAYVLGAVAGGKMTLSEAVKNAKNLGYTEPDPRLDLNGMDVARKAVILARLSGLTGVELIKLDIESLVPKQLENCSVDEFMEGLSAYDNDFAARVAAVEETPGSKLHYAAKVDVQAKKVTVGPMACDAAHPFNSAGPDNLIAITTDFYNPRPLVVQGAGAGGDVTATGVLADILLCRS